MLNTRLIELININYLFIGTFIFACILTLFYILLRSKKKGMQEELSESNYLIKNIKATMGLEKNLDSILELISGTMEAPMYSFYIWDNKKEEFVLKSVRHVADKFEKIKPSYSGLTPYKKESYLPPIAIDSSNVPEKIGMIQEGEIPLLVIPFEKAKGLIRIGPITYIKKKTRKKLKRIAQQLEYILEDLIKTEDVMNQVELIVSSSNALQNISSITLDPHVTLEIMLRVFIQSFGANGGFFTQKNAPYSDVPVLIERDNPFKKELLKDDRLYYVIQSLMDDDDVTIMSSEDPKYYKLPSYFSLLDASEIQIVRPFPQQDSFFVFWTENTQENKQLQYNKLKAFAHDFSNIINYQSALLDLSKHYIKMLKMLAQWLDNLNPYTVGYSELMSRYCAVIARELELSEEEIEEIALAGYLSNIGVLGLSIDLFQKEGQYSEIEYEMMKLHAEVGANIVQVTTGNKQVASYIMHHHERVDGNGYPVGIKREEIPIGARIIAVVQTFIAKINGRKYRSPLSFDEALESLTSASGTQLDTSIVNVFIEWFQKKRKNPNSIHRSLGYCWEMACVPQSICENCPVYQEQAIHCWEVENNYCKAHGKSCETCFVRTEFMGRTGVE